MKPLSNGLILAVAVSASGAFADPVAHKVLKKDEGISHGRYVTGGVLGSIPGFGIGHAIQKRYAKSRAWIFTATESAAAAYLVTISLFACDGATGSRYDDCWKEHNQKVAIGSLFYWGFHIWEIVDVWTGVKIKEESKTPVVLLPSLLKHETPGLVLAIGF